METKSILAEIDLQIAALKKARNLLTSSAKVSTIAVGRKAPKANKNKKHHMSPEGRARVAAAQKRRWAAKAKASR